MPRATPTIREVAAAAEVSVGLVSLAYHHPQRVKAATRARILDAARRLGYRPNVAASLLRSRAAQANQLTRQVNIAFLTAEQDRRTQAGVTLYQEGASARCAELGYGFERIDLALERLGRDPSRTLHARGVAGLVLGPFYQPELLRPFRWEFFAAVKCGGYEGLPPLHQAHTSVFQAVRTACQRLHAAGCRRIGAAFLRHDPPIEDDDRRLGAYTATLTSLGLAPLPVFSAQTLDAQAFGAWYDRHRPDGLIDFALSSAFWLREHGRAMPEELRYITLTHSGNEKAGWSECCGDFDAVGRAAVDWCDQLLRHRTYGLPSEPHIMFLPPRWVARASCPEGAGIDSMPCPLPRRRRVRSLNV